jgi:hypothetical protein
MFFGSAMPQLGIYMAIVVRAKAWPVFQEMNSISKTEKYVNFEDAFNYESFPVSRCATCPCPQANADLNNKQPRK